MQAWIGEAQAGTHNLTKALKTYEKAATILQTKRRTTTRAATWQWWRRRSAALVKMGNLHEASAEYAQVLDTAKLSFSIEHKDFPGIYAAADAYAGLGDVAAAEAHKTQDPALRSKLTTEARTEYEKSLNTWKQITNPSPLNGNGYLAGDPKEVVRHLAALGRGTS
jgi:tetratricopeptide (TPR) repeat protein